MAPDPHSHSDRNMGRVHHRASATTGYLLLLANSLEAVRGDTLESLSGQILGKGGFFRRLRAGGDCTTMTAEIVLAWFRANWPATIPWPEQPEAVPLPGKFSAPTGAVKGLPGLSPEYLADLAIADIWVNGRRPIWWGDIEVRRFLTETHRQMSIVCAARFGQDRFGSRCPKKSAIHEYWQRLDHLASVERGAA